MGLHDRDYVREKDFNYKKMEYNVPNSSASSNDSPSHFDHDDTAIVVKKAVYPSLRTVLKETKDVESKNVESFDFIHFIIYPFSVYVIGFFIYLFIALHTGGQNLSFTANLILYHIFYFSYLYYHIRYR